MTLNDTIKVEPRGPIEILSLNRPEALNALSPDMVGALERPTRTERLHERPEVRVVILRGEGRAFCAGLDIKQSAGRESQPGESRLLATWRSQTSIANLYRKMRSASAAVHRARGRARPAAAGSRCCWPRTSASARRAFG